MNNKEILEKAIQKAIDNGFKIIIGDILVTRIDCEDLDKIYIHFFDNETNESDMFTFNLWKIIFSHDFAKSFWGEELERRWRCKTCNYSKKYFSHNDSEYCPNDGKHLIDNNEPKNKFDQDWARKLQEMILEENPIKYLEEFL
ncbi:MAG: hypothetical protein PHO75_02330 [Candidatus Shapirobacteria bacterium]|nr:hypothetical protein [Candidatus Shapirobacteria bacterium]